MTRSLWFRRLAAMLAFVPVLWMVPPVMAQDLFFDDEEEVIDTEDYFIDEDEVEVFESEDFGPPMTTGLVIPGENLDPALAVVISDIIVEQLAFVPDVEPTDYYMLKDEFDIMGGELAVECAFDPVCLGRVGADVALDEIIMGRAIGSSGGEIQLVLDRVNVETRSIVRYRQVTTETDRESLSEAIATQLLYLYDLQRDDDPNVVVGPTGPSKFQVAMAWTTLGLGVASLITAVVFGVSAKQKEDDVVSARLIEDDVLDLTQQEAAAMLEDAESDALISNVMLGVGLALIGVSVLLFLITPGEDIDTEAEQVSRRSIRTPIFGPTVSEDGVGVYGMFRF